MDVLSDQRLSASAKVIYALLDEMGQGRPVGIRQAEIADLVSISRKTTIAQLRELHARNHIRVSTYITNDGRSVRTYQTRVSASERALTPIFY